MIRLKVVLGLALLVAGIALPVPLRGQSRGAIALREAMETETVKGDLDKALDQYEKLADGSDRAVAAQALLRIARIYELQGNAEARRVYERIIARFPDQKDAVARARAQLRVSTAQLVWDLTSNAPQPFRHDRDAGEGSVSADGRYICFTVGLQEGSSYRSYLAVRELGDGTERIFRNAPKPDGSEGCSFSPAGDQIAYSWHEEPDRPHDWQVRVVSRIDNAAPRTLLQHSAKWFSTPVWSPDGRSIAVRAMDGSERAGGRGEILLASVRDGATRVLPSPGGWRMFFSPDGRYLAFDRRPAGFNTQRDVFVLAVQGGAEMNVTAYPSDDYAMGWSSDSSRVLFASDRSGTNGLYTVSFADGNRQGSPTLLRAAIGNAAPMGVTAAGALFYHARSGGAARFLQIAECESATARCTGEPVAVGPADAMALAWSPDNRYLAYLSPGNASSGGAPTLRIRSADGASVREVPSGELPLGGSVSLAWSPDGHTVAVATMSGARLSLVDVELDRAHVTWTGRVASITNLTWSADGRKLYYRVNPDGANKDSVLVERDIASHRDRELLRRTGPTGIAGWSLSPDGQSIWAFVRAAGSATADLLAVPVSGGEPRAIVRGLSVAAGVNVSPDRRYVATAGRVGGTTDTAVAIIPVDGAPREVIRVAAPASVTNVMWARDGRTVYFRRSDGSGDRRAELWHADISGGVARRVDGAPDLELGLPVAFSPDGRRLAYVRGDGSGAAKTEVWKLENFLPPAPGR